MARMTTTMTTIHSVSPTSYPLCPCTGLDTLSELKATAESEGRALLETEQRKYDKLIRRADDIQDALEDIRQQAQETIASRRAELNRLAPPKESDKCRTYSAASRRGAPRPPLPRPTRS